ncbi:isoleucyl-tRNA synthetase [Thermocrinis albus DSM 14484]|uniref:Isoleucine--tRNA ligase n=1 Tax=Thermocrinis albus (strain DSM 14484 / JCM 11386 / HI 11/12) TaxID=638303 RepID=D3SLT2_THEAH|nr:isoleucine--tRNA ligase [Thermocrinis albus]ADC89712.1 isoleucyl-tRNA synthetase [Thermocrinis albus DSM 14484]
MRDYRDTLNLPRTEFPMKASLPQKEPHILQKWKDLYQRLREARKDCPTFVLHDGPPYANGHIHIGHALNKILKDVINKYWLLKGYRVDYVPGWDCHGLPIEQQVEKELKAKKIRKEDLPKVEFRRLCREYAERFVQIQKEEFVRLGVLSDWDNPYLTMDPLYQAQEIRELGRLFSKGLVVRSKKPVYWCIYDKTAEAEAEVEYYQKEDPSVYVKFPVKNSPNLYLVVWTTTPWTLPANRGVMVGENYRYIFWKVDEKIYIVAEELLESLKEKLGKEGQVIKRVTGKDLLHMEYIPPYHQEPQKVYPSEFVELSAGTGIVHMAPGHGREDYTVGLRYGIEPFSPVDDEGRFTQDAPSFLQGVRVFEANQLILEDLRKRGLLLHEEKIVHSYPHCWRCKNPVIFRATDQWFVNLSAPVEGGKTLRELCLEEIHKVRWIPPQGKNRIFSMVENRPDWCISRQRYWGVPITVLYCKNCGYVIKDQWLFEKVAQLVENSPTGADVWFTLPVEDLLPQGYRCPACGGDEFLKEEDILDVWFDSGSSHAFVLRRRGIDKADMYLEGSDQHRGWFQASLLESVASYGHAPYRSVLTHGFTVDEQGRKMSKSLGNVVSPQEVLKEYGADILRLWVVSEDYTEDIRLGKGILQRLAEDYKKIRNTLRFLLGNLYDFTIQNTVEYQNLHPLDRWMVSYLQKVLEKMHLYYQEYTFHRVFHLIRNFCSVELSSFYLDVLKDRLYVYAPDSWERRSAQTVLYQLLIALTTGVAPFLSFTAEEVWDHVRKIDPSLPDSVFLYRMPEPDPAWVDEELLKDFDVILKVRDDAMSAIELARRQKEVNHPYEVHLFVWGREDVLSILAKYRENLKFFFSVSSVSLEEGGKYRHASEELQGLWVGAQRVEGVKCPRCWLYYPQEEMEGELCKRCAEVLRYVGHSS